MAFDLSSVLNQAQQVSEQQSSENSNNFPRIIYPGMGTLKVKLLYNPKSGCVSRLIRRHKVQDKNHTCLKTYGQDCPICKMVENINNALNLDLWQFNDRARGLSYAQYVGSDGYSWDNDQPEVGELILLMYPWGVYQDINRIISGAGVNAEELIAKNEGKVLNIIHSKVNGRHEYKAEVEAFAQPFKSCKDDAEFESYLNNLYDLNEAIAPREINQDLINDANDVAEILSREYLHGVSNAMSGGFSGNSMNQNTQTIEINGQQYVNVNGQYVPIAAVSPVPNPAPAVSSVPNPAPAVSQQVASPAQTVPSQNNFSQNMNPSAESTPVASVPTTADGQSMPECFGKHQDGDPKCLCCVHEMGCMVTA